MCLTTCKTIPDFPLQPVIKYKSVIVNKSGSVINGVKLELEFTDGDGDLGLSSNDDTGPFAPNNDIFGNPTNDNYYNIFYTFLIQDSISTFNECKSIPTCSQIIINNNYIITVSGMKKDTTVNESLSSVILRASKARFPYLNPDGKKRPISGTLNYNISIPTYFEKKRLKLKIFIKDRALNNSNFVETDTLTIL